MPQNGMNLSIPLSEISVIVLIGAYVLGAIPFGLLLTRACGMGDIRAIGSGNIGATNVLRTGNKKLAALTLLCDALKGFAAVLLAQIYAPEYAAHAGLLAFIGHIAPVWLWFKGGKGVATYIGVALALSPILGLVFAAVWLGVAYASRYSSLAALCALMCVPIEAFIVLGAPTAGVLTLMSGIAIYKHHGNIARLMNGTESKIKLKS